MGNKCSLAIRLDHGNDGDTPIVAGTSLKGKVRIHVKRRLNPTDLYLHLLGKETTIIPRATKSTLHDEKVIARAITRLKDSEHLRLSKGIYSVPFEFLLPSSLPSSTQFPKEGARGFNGKIKYTLRAELGDLKYERAFVVHAAPLPSDIVPCITQPSTHELKALGLLKKGFMSVGASVENSRVGRGQTLRVNVASRNAASVDVVRVRVKLVEMIEYRAQGEQETMKIDLEKLKDIDLPGLDKSKANVGRGVRRGSVRDMEPVYEQIFQDILSGDNQFDIVVPEHARDSYDGNLITISHYLKLTFFTRAMVENPSTKIPIVIGQPRDMEQAPSTSPQRNTNEPIATVIFDDIDRNGEDFTDGESTVEVGSRADIPMAHAMFLGQNQSTGQQHGPAHNTSLLGPDGDSDDGCTGYEVNLPPPMPVPTAPDESLLRQSGGSPGRSGDGMFGYSLPTALAPPENGYLPFTMYNQDNEPRRLRIESYSYDDSDISDLSTSPQRYNVGQHPPDAPRPPNATALLERLIHELQGSIHDYGVVAVKLRQPAYAGLFASLQPLEFARIVAHVSMSHQVQAAHLLAKQVDSFTCDHCAATIPKTSDFFRSNMVETLLPLCIDKRRNYPRIQEKLSDWEKVITKRAFDKLANKR